jgi:subtilisin family serine protease
MCSPRRDLRLFAALGLGWTACADVDPDAVPDVFVDAATRQAVERGEAVDVYLTVAPPRHVLPTDPEAWKAALLPLKERALACADIDRRAITHELPSLPVVGLRLTAEQARDLVHCPGVEGVERPPEMKLHLASTLPIIRADTAHDTRGITGAGQGVAVLDSGLQITQAAFGLCAGGAGSPGCRVAFTLDAVHNDADVASLCHDHGTNVSAIVQGVAPGSDLLFFKILNDAECADAIADGRPEGLSDAGILTALNWLVANGASRNVAAVNMSFGVSTDDWGAWTTTCDGQISSTYDGALETASAAGLLLVAAAGNDGADGVGYPACHSAVMAVANSEDNNDLRGSSNRGPLIDLAAPGTSVTAGGFTMGGTSMASPHVAGAAALLREAVPGVPASTLRLALSTSQALARDPNPNAAVPTYPRLDVLDALDAVQGPIQTLAAPELSFETFGWSLGPTPAYVLVDGHPLPWPNSVFPDNTVVVEDITGWTRDLADATVTVLAEDDANLFVRDVRIVDLDGVGEIDLQSEPGPGDTPTWSHIGASLGDSRAAGFTSPPSTQIVLELSTFNLTSTRMFEVWVDGAPAVVPVRALNVQGDTVTIDLPGHVRDVDDHAITFVATQGLDGWLADVRLTDNLSTRWYVARRPGPHDLGVTYASAAGDWAHFGDTLGRPDLRWVTFVDPGYTSNLELRFRVTDQDVVQSGRVVVNGAWLRLYDQPWGDGDLVQIRLDGIADRLRHLRATFWNELDPSFFVRDVHVVNTVTGQRVDLLTTPQPGDGALGARVADATLGGLPHRTFLAPDVHSAMQVVSRRVRLLPNTSAAVRLDLPSAEHTCTPFVNWETIAEHPEPRCDWHANWAPVGDAVQFVFQVEHCGRGNPAGSEAAVARATLFCFEPGAGWAGTTTVDYDVFSPTPTEATLAVPTPWRDRAISLCSLSMMDGNGDKDTGAQCHLSGAAGVGLNARITRGCQHDTKEKGEALALALAASDDVVVTKVPFDATGQLRVSHPYDAAVNEHHLAFVVPYHVDTSCDDHMTFRSSCFDTGEAVHCDIRKTGSIRKVSGHVLFIDGDFTDPGVMP